MANGAVHVFCFRFSRFGTPPIYHTIGSFTQERLAKDQQELTRADKKKVGMPVGYQKAKLKMGSWCSGGLWKAQQLKLLWIMART